MLLLFHNKSNEITSLWPVLIIVYIHTRRCTYIVIFVVSSRRNKTNPHQGNKYIPVLDATQLQAFKPKRFTYDQLWKLTSNMLQKMYVRELKHFQPHSLLCHLWCTLIASCSLYAKSDTIALKVVKAASTNFFTQSYTTTSHCQFTASIQQYQPNNRFITTSSSGSKTIARSIESIRKLLCRGR